LFFVVLQVKTALFNRPSVFLENDQEIAAVAVLVRPYRKTRSAILRMRSVHNLLSMSSINHFLAARRSQSLLEPPAVRRPQAHSR
jgi:hypothetical protein